MKNHPTNYYLIFLESINESKVQESALGETSGLAGDPAKPAFKRA